MTRTVLENLIKKGVSQKQATVAAEKTDQCPDEALLIAYLAGNLARDRRQAIAAHVNGCHWCLEQLDQAQRASRRFKAGKRGIGGKGGLRHLWLAGAIVAFALSFVFSHYFMQFLVVTLLLGIKWIFATGGAQNVLMVYEAWKHRDRDDAATHTRNRF